MECRERSSTCSMAPIYGRKIIAIVHESLIMPVFKSKVQHTALNYLSLFQLSLLIKAKCALNPALSQAQVKRTSPAVGTHTGTVTICIFLSILSQKKILYFKCLNRCNTLSVHMQCAASITVLLLFRIHTHAIAPSPSDARGRRT